MVTLKKQSEQTKKEAVKPQGEKCDFLLIQKLILTFYKIIERLVSLCYNIFDYLYKRNEILK